MKNIYFIYVLFLTLISCGVQRKNNNLKVYNIADKEISLLNFTKNKDTQIKDKILIDTLYTPYSELWKGYLGDEKTFTEWFNETAYEKSKIWENKSKMINSKFLTKELEKTAYKMYKFTGYYPQGKWFILYGPAWTNLGGLNDGTMLIDLANENNSSEEKIIHFFTHELNHQIHSHTEPKTDKIVLKRIIDEGFATYVSYIFHKNKFSKAQELAYTPEEFKHCQENEDKLITLLKKHYNSTDEDISRDFADRNFKIGGKYPGGIGYYIGFRIVEEFVKNNGKDSWKNIYTMDVSEVLKQSKILKHEEL